MLAVAASPAFGSEKKLEKWLRAGSWAQGFEYCDRELVPEVSRRPDLRNVSTEYLSRLAVYCAALASGKGDELSSGWWWYTAASLDLKTAENLLPEMRKMGLLQTLPAARNQGSSYEPKPGEEKMVRLLSGEIVPGTPPKPLTRLKAPDYMFRPITGVATSAVEIEFVVSRDGVPQQPLLLDAHALPVHVLYAYHYFSAWRFEPAKVNDEPVESLYTLSVSVQRGE
ncbi:MAG TPA: hypothetical protein VGS22_03165 [Thermoanaerobaculia bacterium]|nr:hypothetical protein [Thermoanaerobaculia bacterium]